MSTAFVTNAQFILRYDTRIVAECCSDTGTPVNDVPSNANLTQALVDASGQVLLYALKGGRYLEADLVALTGNALGALQWMVSVLAMHALRQRRGMNEETEDNEVEKVEKLLESLAKGDVVFGTPGAIEYSVAKSPSIDIQSISDNNFLRDSVRIFPQRRYTKDQY